MVQSVQHGPTTHVYEVETKRPINWELKRDSTQRRLLSPKRKKKKKLWRWKETRNTTAFPWVDRRSSVWGGRNLTTNKKRRYGGEGRKMQSKKRGNKEKLKRIYFEVEPATCSAEYWNTRIVTTNLRKIWTFGLFTNSKQWFVFN